MTPFAHRIVKQMLLPKSKRTFTDHVELFAEMSDIHCFECTEVAPLVTDLLSDPPEDGNYEEALKAVGGALIDGKTFLPAPKTWIETKTTTGVSGYLLLERDGWVHVVSAYEGDGMFGTLYETIAFRLGDDGSPLSYGNASRLGAAIELNKSPYTVASTWAVLCTLALINTPRIIGRRQHMPSAGLERRLLKGSRAIGNFPIHAWTEILLKVRAPANMSEDVPVEAHLTGQRALHFCRAHLRLKNGRVEFVRAHWRGDASLGIKQSRYTVTQ